MDSSKRREPKEAVKPYVIESTGKGSVATGCELSQKEVDVIIGKIMSCLKRQIQNDDVLPKSVSRSVPRKYDGEW